MSGDDEAAEILSDTSSEPDRSWGAVSRPALFVLPLMPAHSSSARCACAPRRDSCTSVASRFEPFVNLRFKPSKLSTELRGTATVANSAQP